MFNDPTNRELDRISLLESRDLVLRAFKSLHQRNLAANKATEIISHLSQGKSYSKAAEVADEIIQPLLQYYSVVALSRAAILLLSPNLREASLPAKHGLSAVGWKEHLDSGKSWLDARIRVTQGTFSVFGEITANKSFIHIYMPESKMIALEIPGSSKYPDDFEFSVGDLFRRIPELTKLYEAIVEKPAGNWLCQIKDHYDPWKLVITSNSLGLPQKATASELLNIDSRQIEEISTSYFGSGPTRELDINLKASDPESIKPYISNLVSVEGGYPFLLEPFDNGVKLSYQSILLACSYALGMLVRYYPTYWISIIQHEKGDALWPLLQAAAINTKRFSASIAEYF